MRFDKSTQEAFRAFAALGHLGFVVGGSIAIGFFAGDWLDRRYGTSPWFTTVMMVLFLFGAGWQSWRTLRAYARDSGTDDARRGGPPA